MVDNGEKKKTPVVTLKSFFGLREDENLRGFLEELRELSDTEKEALAEGITSGTLTY